MIDPKSLIGMTQGARKRAALRSACMPSGELSRAATERAYTEARKLYRVGERLRACPVCHGSADFAGSCADRSFGTIRPSNSLISKHGCDGSGVVVKPIKIRALGVDSWHAFKEAYEKEQEQIAKTWGGILQEKVNDICAENGYPADLAPQVIIKAKP